MNKNTRSIRHSWTTMMLVSACATIALGQNAPPGVGGGQGGPGGGPGGPGGGPPRNTPYTLSGTYTLSGKTQKSSLATFSSDTTDVSAVYVKSNADLTLTDPTISTTGATSSDDNSSFYGLNAGVLATLNSKIKITGGTVSTTGSGANGVFASGAGASVSLANVTVKTTGDGAHGVMATAGGKLSLDQVQITTAGGHAAAVATDRGGGTITVTGGNFNTSGDRSPAIYSTGVIKVTGATMTATGAEAAVIEGKNSIILTDTNLTGSVSRGVMIYRSFSGDTQGNGGTFAMKGGTLNATAGPAFYVTNTTATLFVTGVTFNTSSGILLDAAAGQWGRSGSNGGVANFTADNEKLTGDLTADTTSSITAKLQNKTTLTGTVRGAAITLDGSSIWTVTGDSTITTLSDLQGMSGNSFINIAGNGHSVVYDSTLRTNAALGSRAYDLAGGGRLVPSKPLMRNNNQNTPGSTNLNGTTPGTGGNTGGARGGGRR